jgi:PIN domain nuclease of toxin-antitoxin system
MADRLALATSMRLGVPVLTAESAWRDIGGFHVVVIR